MIDFIRLSQTHLNLLEICPPKFQQVYLDGFSSIPHPEQQESLAWGSRFHQLMQQRELGLPIESLLATDRELESSITALIQATSDVWNNNNDNWREAEHCRTYAIGNFLLTVIYDLLIAETQTAKIFDWKTYRQPPKKHKLANNWQTRLYLYLLAETSSYSPEQISMTYWFVKSANPQSFTFTYSDAQHTKTEQDLTNLLNGLETWLKPEQLSDSAFPHRTNCETNCPFNQFFRNKALSNNKEFPKNSGDLNNRLEADWLTSVAEIEEISI